MASQETSSNLHVDESWSRTSLRVSRTKHTWTITDFSLMKKQIYSNSFPIVDDNYVTWMLMMSPRGNSKENEAFVSLRLYVLELEGDAETFKFSVNGKFSILDNKKCEYVSRTFEKDCIGLDEYRLERFISRDFLFGDAEALLPDDKLTIVCELNVFGDWNRISGAETTKVPECKLSDDLYKLFEEPKFTDAVISASGKEFKVHKAILAARSPVFSAMFEHPMEEKKNSRVEINDIKQEVFEEVLRFIYSGKVMDLDMTEDLLAAADKYDLGRLKIMCERALLEKLSMKNAVDILVLADLHSSATLKTNVINYIAQHPKAMQYNDGWESIISSHPHLFAEAFAALANI